VRGGRATNGWGFWAVESKEGTTLRNLRNKLRRQLDPEEAGLEEGEDNELDDRASASTKELQYQFWTGFVEYVRDSDAPFLPKAPRRQNWMSIAVGTTRYHIDVVTSAFSLGPDLPGPEIRVDFYIANDHPFYERLLTQREEVEQAYGSHLSFHRSEGVKSARIYERLKVDVFDESRWSEYYEWLTERVVRMREVMLGFAR
jgi:hypothetical protein